MLELAEQLYAAGIPVFPCRGDKGPAVGKDESWKEYATRPPTDHHWPSPLVGVPIPARVFVLDLDTYKGITREQVDTLLGVKLPWDRALIQITMQGGQHYAFRCEWDAKQGANLGLRGLDTRAANKGYIATGAPYYTPCGFGVYALAFPDALPSLPEETRAFFEVTAPLEPVALPEGDKDTDNIVAALRHIDPSCNRVQWVKVGLALRHHFHDDEIAGYAVFDRWSAGEFWAPLNGDAPINYVPEDMEHQWGSFRPEGGVAIGSLFYEAIQAGWVPPPSLDTAGAFGPGAAEADQFNELVDMLQAFGGDPKRTNDLLEAIRTLPGNHLQRATLSAILSRELKEAGLLSKPVKNEIDGLAEDVKAYKIGTVYDKNHTENAFSFLDAHYPGQRLLRSQEVWYAYTGRAWEEVTDVALRHKLACDMVPSRPQTSTVSGTYSMLVDLALSHREIGDTPQHLALFQNGVLDLITGDVYPHDSAYFTTNILPYGYNPNARCDTWLAFLEEVFEGDSERVALLQEWFGYMLSPSYAHHKIMLLLGLPRSGKGTIGRMLEQVVGPQNFTGGSLHAFLSDAFLESLRTKSVIFSGDTEKRVSRNTIDTVIERIKKISGNDAVTFDRKYKSTLSQTLPSRITLASNQVPGLFDDSGALASRLLVLPFDVSFLGREDPYLMDKLMPELEGVGYWALQGLARLNAAGRFTEPEASKMEAQFIAEAYSPLKQFIDEVCTLGGDHVTSSEDIHDAYKVWALAQSEGRILNRKPFVGSFKDATRGRNCKYGKHRVDGKAVRGFKGLVVGKIESRTAAAFKPQVVT